MEASWGLLKASWRPLEGLKTRVSVPTLFLTPLARTPLLRGKSGGRRQWGSPVGGGRTCGPGGGFSGGVDRPTANRQLFPQLFPKLLGRQACECGRHSYRHVLASGCVYVPLDCPPSCLS